jgi:hypothetical protein
MDIIEENGHINSINIIVGVHMQNVELFQSQGDSCHDVTVLMIKYQYPSLHIHLMQK